MLRKIILQLTIPSFRRSVSTYYRICIILYTQPTYEIDPSTNLTSYPPYFFISYRILLAFSWIFSFHNTEKIKHLPERCKHNKANEYNQIDFFFFHFEGYKVNNLMGIASLAPSPAFSYSKFTISIIFCYVPPKIIDHPFLLCFSLQQKKLHPQVQLCKVGNLMKKHWICTRT